MIFESEVYQESQKVSCILRSRPTLQILETWCPDTELLPDSRKSSNNLVKMFSSNYVLLLPLLLLPLVSPIEIRRRTPSWPHPYWDIPGDYCRSLMFYVKSNQCQITHQLDIRDIRLNEKLTLRRAKYPAMDCCSGRYKQICTFLVLFFLKLPFLWDFWHQNDFLDIIVCCRQDRCSVPILGTLCYCDTFCNRFLQNADVVLSLYF